MSDAAPDPAHAVPKETTPTWEMELLVSGATVFGLIQLPALIDAAYFRVMNLSPQDYASLLFPVWLYSKVATISLVFTFVAHLCLRGYWVALVGMNSVYPGGIRWENLRKGNLLFRSDDEGAPSMAATIENADNRATRVFASGFGFAMLMLKLTLLVLLILGSCVLVDAILGAGHTKQVFATLTLVLMVPLMVASMLDRRYGHSLPPEHLLRRIVSRLLAAYSRFGMGPRSNPLIALFISNEGRPKAMAILLSFMVPVIIVLMAQNSVANGRLPMGMFVGLSTDSPYSSISSPNAFYADAGGERAGRLPLPFIPARVVTGPYLPLFVPFIPRLHGPELQAACPSTLAQATEPAGTRARLDCLAKLTSIRIDGLAQQVEFQASTDPDSGQPGMLAMLPVGALPSGRHELSLNTPGYSNSKSARPDRRYLIAFWK